MNENIDPQASNAPRMDAEEMLNGILEWVDLESPSHDGACVNRMVDRVEADMRGQHAA